MKTKFGYAALVSCFFCILLHGMEQKEAVAPAVQKVDEVSKAIEEAIIHYYVAQLNNDAYIQYMVLKKFNITARATILLGVLNMQVEDKSEPEGVYAYLKSIFYKQKTTAKRQITQNFLEHVCGGTSGQTYQDLRQSQEQLNEQILLKTFHNFRSRPYCY